MNTTIGPFTLDDIQERTLLRVRDAMCRYKKRVLVSAPTGFGKCLAKGTPVLMFDGTTKAVEDIDVGDLLMGADSSPRTVLSLGGGFGDMFRVTPTKGVPYVVNADHILALRFTGGTHKQYKEYKDSPFIEIAVRDYMAKSDTFKYRVKGYRVAVDFPAKQVPLDPYYLGLWIGDGTRRTTAITKPDPEVLECIKQVALLYGGTAVSHYPKDRCQSHSIRFNEPWERSNPNIIYLALMSLGITDQKRVPSLYKVNSRAVRLEVLAGLLDSDGSMALGGFDFISKSETIANDVAFLARSLGFYAYVSMCEKQCVNNGKWGVYFRVGISGDCHLIPTRIARKRASKRLQKKDVLVTGIKVEPVGEGEFFGFQIDGDGLFLLGDFTVTHNTILSMAIAGLSAARGTQVDFVVSGRTLVAQTAKKAERAGLNHSVWIAGHEDPFNHFALLRIISKETLESRRENSNWHPGKILIVDEVDISLSAIWKKLQDEYEYVIGLTGTPCDGRGCGLGQHFDEMVIAANYSELIKSGRLVDVPESKCFSPYRPDLEGAKAGADGDYQKTWLSSRMNTDKLVGGVVEYWTKLAEGRPTLVCCVDKLHTVHVCEAFNEAKINAEYVIDDTQERERQAIFKRVERGETKVIVNCATLTRGFDLPCISCLVLAKPTKRLRTYLQMVGRVLRAAPGKTDAMVIDHSGSVWRHGWPTDDRDWTLDSDVTVEELAEKQKTPKQEVERFCPECACLMKYSAVCPNCGFKKPVRSQAAETVEGKLVSVKRQQIKKNNPNKNEFQSAWMRCLAVKANMGQSYSAAASMFHGQTGKWPEQAGVGPVADYGRRNWKIGVLWPGFIRKKAGA